MGYRVVISPRSGRDIEGIRTWIAAESQNPEVSTRFIRQLLNACMKLASHPERFAAYSGASRWRMMPYRNYLVFFEVLEGEVRIGHIRHAARRPFRG